MYFTCLYCGQRLVWRYGLGWVHEEGGLYMMYCKDCGWKGAPNPSPKECPKCGSKKLREDHIARPAPLEE